MLPSSFQHDQEHERCHQCHHVVMNGSHWVSISQEEQVILCPECCVGVYQCVECNQLVSTHGIGQFQEMVYGGADNVWDDFFIFCRVCFVSLVRQKQEDSESSQTDTEEDEVFVCEVAADTQPIG